MAAQVDRSQELKLRDLVEHFEENVQNQFLVTDNGRPVAHARRPEDVQKPLVRRLQGENVNDPLHQMVFVSLQEFSDHELVTLQDLVQCLMHSLLLVLNSMIQNYIEPGLTYI